MRRGIFITFEGGEGAGKTSQIKRLASWLRQQGKKAVVTREPGGTPLADQIREILLNPRHRGMNPTLELLLYETARRDHVAKVIRPALQRGSIVLCDRFTDATLAYQGFGRKLPLRRIQSWNRAATGGLQPAVTFLLDLPPDLGIRRAKGRGGRDRFHEEAKSFHQQVRQGYLTLAKKERTRFRLIRGTLAPKQVAEMIRREVMKIL